MNDSVENINTTIELVQAAQIGDEKALNALFARYWPRVLRIVSFRTGRKLAAFVDHEDLAQEALLRVFRNLPEFEHRSEGSFRHWVAVCVEREICNQDRARTAAKRGGGKERRFGDCGQSSLLSGIFQASVETPSGVVATKEMEERVEDAILELEPHHRELIVQRYLCELTFVEMAQNLQLDESSVRKACRRAEARVREQLAS